MKNKFLKLFCISMICLTFLSSCSNTGASSSKTLVLKNGFLIDGTGAEPQKNSTIIIEAGKIKDVGTADKVKIPDNAEIIDLKGAAVMPGFIDTHMHNTYHEAKLQNWLKHGVTTVRDLGLLSSPLDRFPYVEQRIFENFKELLNKNNKNATLLSADFILSPEGGYGHMHYKSAEDAKKEVLKLIDGGADSIKFSIEDDCQLKKWNMPTYDEVKAIVDAAHSKNKKVAVHITHCRNLQWAVDANADAIAHMAIDYVDDKTIKEIVDKNIYWIPTFEVFKNADIKFGGQCINYALNNLSNFYEAGGKVAFGTDYSGLGGKFDEDFPITEVKFMKEAGMSNMDIIVAATKNSAYVCGISQKVGTLEPGKNADILIVNGNPLEDINSLTKTKMVIHNGEIIK